MFSYCYHIIPRVGLVCQQAAVLGLDTVFLLGKALPKAIPASVTQGALFGLSCCSVIGFPYQVSLLRKTYHDFRHSISSTEKWVMLATAVKIAYVTSGLLLNSGNLVAATAGLFGEDAFQSTLYQIMIPFGEASIGVGVILMLSYLYFFRQVLKNSDAVAEALPFLARDNLDVEEPLNAQQLASEIRYCMDKDTLTDMIDHFDVVRAPGFAEQAIKNIQTQRNVALGGGVLLSMIGYGLMAVEKYYTPNSLQAAVINEAMALFHAINDSVRLGMEVCQRNRIESLNTNHL